MDKCLDAASLLALSRAEKHGFDFTVGHVASLAVALFERAARDGYQPGREDIVKTLAALSRLSTRDSGTPANGTAEPM